MAKEYKTVDTVTLKGLQQAERLKANGWEQYRVGMFSIQFMRDKPKRKRTPKN